MQKLNISLQVTVAAYHRSFGGKLSTKRSAHEIDYFRLSMTLRQRKQPRIKSQQNLANPVSGSKAGATYSAEAVDFPPGAQVGCSTEKVSSHLSLLVSLPFVILDSTFFASRDLASSAAVSKR